MFLIDCPNLSNSALPRNFDHFQIHKQQKKVSENPVNSIFKFCIVLVPVPCTTSKMKITGFVNFA